MPGKQMAIDADLNAGRDRRGRSPPAPPVFSPADAVATITDPVANNVFITTDRFGNVETYEDAYGNVTTYERDADGLVTEMTSAQP